MQEYLSGWYRSVSDDTPGDPIFLAGINKIVDQRCRLLGLYKPEKYVVGGIDPKEIGEAFSEALIEDATITNGECKYGPKVIP